MLLPSALTCDFSQRRANYRASAALYASPPTSPPALPVTSTLPTTSLAATCRALQGMLAASTSSLCQLPTPPLAHAPSPVPAAFKLRLRARANRGAVGGAQGESAAASTAAAAAAAAAAASARKRVAKRVAPRGVNKRRRESEDEGDEEMDSDEGVREMTTSSAEACHLVQPAQQPPAQQRQADQPAASSPRLEADNDDDDDIRIQAPSTPKRLRLAPEIIPLGLERADFHGLQARSTAADPLHTNTQPRDSSNHHLNDLDRDSTSSHNHPIDPLALWTTEDDRLLVELVLTKLKLSRSDWQDCARSLGRDKASVGRRWKSLMAGGEVGLKRSGGGSGARRMKIHGTWK